MPLQSRIRRSSVSTPASESTCSLALLASDLGEIEEVGLGEIERRRHRKRLVDELVVRGNQMHLRPSSTRARSASSASIPATPPPQITTRLGPRDPRDRAIVSLDA